MKRDASRTRGELVVQLPAGQPPTAPIWSRPAPKGGAAAKLLRRKKVAIGFRMSRVTVNAAAGAQAVLSLGEGAAPRVFLSIRNASTSAGVLLVAFGTQPTSIEACDYELEPGGVLLLDQPANVPQDDVWTFSSAGAVGSISYGMKG